MRDKALDKQIGEHEARMLAWPVTEVKPLCVAEGCGAVALETGFCAKDEAGLVAFFADELKTLSDAVIAPVTWYRASCLHTIDLNQAWALKMAVLAELTARRNPLVMLNRISASEVERMCSQDSGGAPIEVLTVPPHADVADAPANRERRAELMGKLPRVQVGVATPTTVTAPARGEFRLRFALCVVAILGIAAILAIR